MRAWLVIDQAPLFLPLTDGSRQPLASSSLNDSKRVPFSSLYLACSLYIYTHTYIYIQCIYIYTHCRWVPCESIFFLSRRGYSLMNTWSSQLCWCCSLTAYIKGQSGACAFNSLHRLSFSLCQRITLKKWRGKGEKKIKEKERRENKNDLYADWESVGPCCVRHAIEHYVTLGYCPFAVCTHGGAARADSMGSNMGWLFSPSVFSRSRWVTPR